MSKRGQEKKKKREKKNVVQVKLPKDALKRINLGNSFAEYDRVLRKERSVFVRTPAIETALNEEMDRCFFVGRRGTGKTALTFYLQEHLRSAVLIHPQAFAPLDLAVDIDELRDTRQRPFRSIVVSYQRALLGEVLAEWERQNLIRFDQLQGLLKREKKPVQEHSYDSRMLSFVGEILEAHRAGDETRWLELVGLPKQLSKEMVNLQGGGSNWKLTLMIDRIDEGWDGSDKAVIFLMGLMHACVQLAAQMPIVRPILFLRENIFERVRQIDNEFSRLETSVVSMDWTENLLLQMVERRLNLPFSTRLAVGGPTWDYFFESASAQSSRSMVFDFCQRRPRDVLTYCSFAIEEARSRLHERVTLEDLQAARRRFSDSRLKDLGDEYAENFPQLQLVLRLFYGLGTEFTLPGVDAFLRKLVASDDIQRHCKEWIFDYASPDRFVHLLYDIGFFGITDSKGVAQYRALGPRSATPPAISSQTHAVVHPSYHEALDLRPVVIEHLDDSVSLQTAGVLAELPGAIGLNEYKDQLEEILEDLESLPTGRETAGQFETIVGNVIRLCFFRSLTNIEPHVRDVEGRVIRDWIASNTATGGFWEVMRQRYQATQVIWECKNFTDLKAAAFQQISYYLSTPIGSFGVIAFRGTTKKHYYEHIKRVSAATKGGVVILLGESDLKVFIRQAINGKVKQSHIQDIYDRTVREIS